MPTPGSLALVGVTAALLLYPRRTRPFAAFVLAACWALWNVHGRLQDRLPAGFTNQAIPLHGTVSSIPQYSADLVSFRFTPDRPSAVDGRPSHWLIRWYEEAPALAAGQRWRLVVTAKPPWGRVNFQGADREQWLFANGVGALGTVRNGELLTEPGPASSRILAWRQRIFWAIAEAVPGPRERGVVQALATADRSGLERTDREVLALTGTSHLLAISGLHIGLAALGAALLARALLGLLATASAARWVPHGAATAGLSAAAAYAALAGFGVPTLRALLMLAVGSVALLLARSIHPFRAWLLAFAAVLLIDPFAGLTAGFWFSFLAVAALLLLSTPRPCRWPRWKSLLFAQFAVGIVLMPLSASWFGGFSPSGLAANLVAIPWVSVVVVPPVLAGVALHAFSAALADLAWQLAGATSLALLTFLDAIADAQGALSALRTLALPQTAAAVLGAGLLLLPRGLPARWSGVFLLLPLALPPERPADASGAEIEFLDAGQGTAVLFEHAGHRLLYDTGPGDGADGNLVASVILPALQSRGRAPPDTIVVSHGDLDHAGGLESLRQRFPHAEFRVSLRHAKPGDRACRAGDRWQRGNARFDILHPGPWLPYLGNDSSCVLSVRVGGQRILLPGDVSRTVEQRLVEAGLGRHAVMLVPHHGSETSSSGGLISAVQPRLVVATAGPGNRFGFPRASVRQRYDRTGAALWSTGECGAVRIRLSAPGTVYATSARLERPAAWRWPAAAGCPWREQFPLQARATAQP